MKLAAVYNVWDGLEHLEKSISLLYQHVDHVVLVWQDVSNFGEHNPDTSIMVQHLAANYPKVAHVYYQPDLRRGGTGNETNKRLIGAQYAKSLGCTHYIHLDTDEYYTDFDQGKKFVLEHNLDTSYCKLITYWKSAEYRYEPLENYYVPFICKITSMANGYFPVLVDPTRGAMPNGRCKEVPIFMHHMSYVRKNIAQKLRNSSASVNWRNKIESMCEQFEQWQDGQPHPFMGGYKIVKTQNLFQ